MQSQANKRRPPLPPDTVVCLIRNDVDDMTNQPVYAADLRRVWTLIKRRIAPASFWTLDRRGAPFVRLRAFLASEDATPENVRRVADLGLQWARMVVAAAAVGDPKTESAMSPTGAVRDWCFGLLVCLDDAIILSAYPRMNITWLTHPLGHVQAYHCWQEVLWQMLGTDAARRMAEAAGTDPAWMGHPSTFLLHG